MISHSLNIVNEFLKVTKYNQDNDFKESDFTPTIKNKPIIDAKKDKIVNYKGLTFSISFLVGINELTDELYCIAFFSNEANLDNHIIITEYLTQMMNLFVDFISNDMFITINENETIIDFFQSFLEERKEGYFPLSNVISSINQGHFHLSHQFCNQTHYIYLTAIVHGDHTIWLQLNFIVDSINKEINMN